MQKRTVASVLVASALLLVLGAASVLAATDFPTKPITLLVGFAPGGGTDLTARAVASVAEKYLGQPVVVVNQPGASGVLAARTLVTSRPDGYTLLLAGGSETTAAPHFQSVPYDPETDFVPIIRFNILSLLITVRADAPWDTLSELIEYMREHPGEVRFAASGTATHYNALMQWIAHRENLDMVTITYEGAGPTLGALLAGDVDVTMTDPAQTQSHFEAGRVKYLATSAPERLPNLPHVPTMLELGYPVVIENMKGLVAPKGTPPEIIQILHDAFKKVYDDPEFRKIAADLNLELSYQNGEDFMESIRTTSALIKEAAEIIRQKQQ